MWHNYYGYRIYSRCEPENTCCTLCSNIKRWEGLRAGLPLQMKSTSRSEGIMGVTNDTKPCTAESSVADIHVPDALVQGLGVQGSRGPHP